MEAYRITPIFSELDTSDDLLIDEVGSCRIDGRIVPWRENLFPEEQPPWGVLFFGALFFSVLFTLGDGVHYMIGTTTKT